MYSTLKTTTLERKFPLLAAAVSVTAFIGVAVSLGWAVIRK